MCELSEHRLDEEPVPDCDCRRCAIMERDRLRAAVQKVKAHMRDTDAGVLRLGLRDNAESRAALHALFELMPNKI